MKSAYPADDGTPWWLDQEWINDRKAPGYGIGDLIVLYIGGKGAPRRAPAILRVVSGTRLDLAWVRTHGRRDDSERWPYVTGVECIHAVPLERAPRPADFGIDARSTQGGYRTLPPENFRKASQVIRRA